MRKNMHGKKRSGPKRKGRYRAFSEIAPRDRATERKDAAVGSGKIGEKDEQKLKRLGVEDSQPPKKSSEKAVSE